jgi:mannose-1-phosphate guanylyltransferase
MKALLLAAGYGKRLLPITSTIPKCLVEINSKPLIDYWLEALFKGGVTEVIINLHYLSDQVQSHIKKSKFQIKIRMLYEVELLNTGGTILHNENLYRDEPLLVIHADNLSSIDIKDFIDTFHKYEKIDLLMHTFITDNPRECGIVEVDKDSRILSYHEKPNKPLGNLANGAVYLISPTVFKVMKSIKKDNLDFARDVIPLIAHNSRAYFDGKYHRDIGSKESLDRAQKEFCK